MANESVMTNGHFGWFAGPETSISDAEWDSGPSLTALQSLENYSATVKVDGSDFNVEASEQVEDRSFADQAGAQSRGFMNASGSVELYTPGRDDETSINAQGWGVFATPRTRLALAQRPVEVQGTPIAAGDEVNVFRVLTDGGSHNRNDASRTLGTTLILQDDIFVNYIVPSSVPTAPAVTPAGPIAAVVGTPLFLTVMYEGRNVTAGAKYVVGDEDIAMSTNGGIIVPQAAGSTTLTVSYPGAADLAPIAITVAAA
jgi:hypothetical protein